MFFYFIPIFIFDSWSRQIASQRLRNSVLYAPSFLTFTSPAFLRDCVYKNLFRVVLSVNSDYSYIPKRHYPIGSLWSGRYSYVSSWSSRSSASPAIPSILWNWKVHGRGRYSPPIFHNPNQTNSGHVLPSYLMLSCCLYPGRPSFLKVSPTRFTHWNFKYSLD